MPSYSTKDKKGELSENKISAEEALGSADMLELEPEPETGPTEEVKEDIQADGQVLETIAKTPQNLSEEARKEEIVSSKKDNESESVLEPAGIGIDEIKELPRRGKKKVYTAGIIITILVLGGVGGVFFFRVRESKQELDNGLRTSDQTQDVQDENSVPDEEVEEEGSEAGLMVVKNEGIGRSEISLEVLNGTDTTGLAGKTADTFEELGYEISKIGNAEDTVGNQLYVDPELEGELGVLLEDVKKQLNISSVSGQLTGSDASARIILGE
ncbi:LytR C-terminal domain-containing protein [Candidatus Woesebacteria bacterium]|nr:LytR C-terminal domain-containing protein [Candidatus Woesebacteria bacterium]